MTHKAKFCTERPRLRTAKQTGRDIKVRGRGALYHHPSVPTR